MARRPPHEVGEDLRQWLADRGMTEKQLSDAINHGRPIKDWVSQSWISRMCSGRFKRESRQVLAVLSYTNIPFYSAKVVNPVGLEVIEEALDEVWDGSTENARIIARLLRSAGALGTRQSHEGGNVRGKASR